MLSKGIAQGREHFRLVRQLPVEHEIVVIDGLQGEAPNQEVNADRGRKTVIMWTVDILERGERVKVPKGQHFALSDVIATPG